MLSNRWPAVPLAVLLLVGCTSSQDGGRPQSPSQKSTAQGKAETAARKLEKQLRRAEQRWDEICAQVAAQVERGEVEVAEEALSRLEQVFPEGHAASRQQLARREELIKLVDKEREAQRQAKLTEEEKNRSEALAKAEQNLAAGRLAEATEAVNFVLAAGPSEEQRTRALGINQQIEQRRGAMRRLASLKQLLGAEDSRQVRSAQIQLEREPDTALALLMKWISEGDTRLIANSLETLRRLGRPEAAQAAMLDVLRDPSKADNWPDVIQQIEHLEHPGAGQAVLDLAVRTEHPRQRASALQILTKLPDPPSETLVRLLPLCLQESQVLSLVLDAMYHGLRVNRQYDLLSRRGLSTPLDDQQREQLGQLSDRLSQIASAQAPDQEENRAGESARVLLTALGRLAPSPLPEVKLLRVNAELPDSPGAALLDGTWNSVEPATMWRYPAKEEGSVVLDLGTERTVTGVRIWNYNVAGQTNRGWKEVDVFVSDTDRALVPIASGIVPPAPGTGEETPDYSTTIPVGYQRGRYVKLQAKSLWSDPEDYSGLAEVEVLGVP